MFVTQLTHRRLPGSPICLGTHSVRIKIQVIVVKLLPNKTYLELGIYARRDHSTRLEVRVSVNPALRLNLNMVNNRGVFSLIQHYPDWIFEWVFKNTQPNIVTVRCA